MTKSVVFLRPTLHCRRADFVLFTDYVSRGANFEPGDGHCDEKVGEFAEREHCTAEYQAESSSDVTHQSQNRVRLFGFDVGVFKLREKYLNTVKSSQI